MQSTVLQKDTSLTTFNQVKSRIAGWNDSMDTIWTPPDKPLDTFQNSIYSHLCLTTAPCPVGFPLSPHRPGSPAGLPPPEGGPVIGARTAEVERLLTYDRATSSIFHLDYTNEASRGWTLASAEAGLFLPYSISYYRFRYSRLVHNSDYCMPY